MFNIILGLYIVAAIGVIAGGSYSFYSKSQSITAILFFVGSLASFVLFGLRWFSGKESLFSKTPVPWPPVINTCPDYLVFRRRMQGGKPQNSCSDLIGVSRNGNLKILNSPTGRFHFPLETASSDPVKRQQELCTRTMADGLTWEGITNGETCTINPTMK
jgi:hypothetical protein